MGHGGRRDPSEYVVITAEVFYDPKRRRNGVRPIEGEVFPQSMKIECARKIREYAVDTRVKLRVVETDREDGEPFLYSSYKWSHEVVRP
tara:strand:- start:1216 stop:1482 length:267 start_codon:yes stop_codon:yes gene_type:complete